jgi:predicted nucleic acid-binding protein
MAGSPKRISWDSCTWIALIQKEKIPGEDGKVEDRYALARSVIDLADEGKIEIATSGLCLAEVCKNPPDAKSADDKIAPFFEHAYILIVAVDTEVGTTARRLMMAKHPGLKPPDAIHLATAIVADVDEMHTFDVKLLALDEKLVKKDGTALKICKPAHGGKPLPLLEAAAPAKPIETQKEEPKLGAPAEAKGSE